MRRDSGEWTEGSVVKTSSDRNSLVQRVHFLCRDGGTVSSQMHPSRLLLCPRTERESVPILFPRPSSDFYWSYHPRVDRDSKTGMTETSSRLVYRPSSLVRTISNHVRASWSDRPTPTDEVCVVGSPSVMAPRSRHSDGPLPVDPSHGGLLAYFPAGLPSETRSAVVSLSTTSKWVSCTRFTEEPPGPTRRPPLKSLVPLNQEREHLKC